MIDKIPIKTLLDHAKQPFIPYTTAKSVMWDGTDKTLYDVVMEGVPMPEIETEYLSTYLLTDNSNTNPLILEDAPKGIYFVPYSSSNRKYTLYYKWHVTDSYTSQRYLLDGRFYKYGDGLETGGNGLIFNFTDNSGSLIYCKDENTYTSHATYVLNNQSTNIRAQHIYEQLPVAYAGLNPTANNQFVHKGYVDSAITGAIEENNTGLNADIMVAINAASRAEAAAENVTTLRERFNTRPTDANIAVNPSGGLCKFLSTGSMTANKPTNDGHIIHMYWDTDAGWDSQLFIGTGATPAVRIRSQNAGTWSNWITMAKQSDVDAKQNKITYGTGDPSGGSDGDVYLKYTA